METLRQVRPDTVVLGLHTQADTRTAKAARGSAPAEERLRQIAKRFDDRAPEERSDSEGDRGCL